MSKSIASSECFVWCSHGIWWHGAVWYRNGNFLNFFTAFISSCFFYIAQCCWTLLFSASKMKVFNVYLSYFWAFYIYVNYLVCLIVCDIHHLINSNFFFPMQWKKLCRELSKGRLFKTFQNLRYINPHVIRNSSLQINLLLPMWIETSKPYLDVIDEWITNGFLVDPRNEFIVKRW